MGKLHGLFYGITCNTQAGSGHYRIYVVYTGWNSFDLTLSHHTRVCIQWNLRIKDKLVHGPLSTIRGLSFIGEFLSKSPTLSLQITMVSLGAAVATMCPWLQIFI